LIGSSIDNATPKPGDLEVVEEGSDKLEFERHSSSDKNKDSSGKQVESKVSKNTPIERGKHNIEFPVGRLEESKSNKLKTDTNNRDGTF